MFSDWNASSWNAIETFFFDEFAKPNYVSIRSPFVRATHFSESKESIKRANSRAHCFYNPKTGLGFILKEHKEVVVLWHQQTTTDSFIGTEIQTKDNEYILLK